MSAETVATTQDHNAERTAGAELGLELILVTDENKDELVRRASRLLIGLGVEPEVVEAPAEQIIAVARRLEVIAPRVKPHKPDQPPKTPIQLKAYLAGMSPAAICRLTGERNLSIPTMYKRLATLLLRGNITTDLITTALTKLATNEGADLEDLLPLPDNVPRPRQPRQQNAHNSQALEESPEHLLLDESEAVKINSSKMLAGGTDSVRAYLNAIGKIPLLTPEQEVELAKKIEAGVLAQELLDNPEKLTERAHVLHPQGDQSALKSELQRLARQGELARERFIIANLRLSILFAKKNLGKGLDFLDVIQEANFGVYRAVQKFDYTLGYKFSTYASKWIKQYIVRAVADQGRAIRVPSYMYERIAKLDRVSKEYLATSGREATLEELAAEMRLPPEKIHETKGYAEQIPLSLNALIDDDGEELHDLVEDESATNPAEYVIQQGLDALRQEAFNAAMRCLSAKEVRIMSLYFGLYGQERTTMTEIASSINKSLAAVSLTVKGSLQKMRTALGEESHSDLIA
jgi:RNA polymerase primary sigma factor